MSMLSDHQNKDTAERLEKILSELDSRKDKDLIDKLFPIYKEAAENSWGLYDSKQLGHLSKKLSNDW